MAGPDPVFLTLLGGLALGALAAQVGGLLSLNWGPRIGVMHNRVRQLSRSAPSAPMRALGAVLVGGLLAGGTFAAYAAEPSAAPERLAAQAAGVVGSGDQLSLKIKAPEGQRILKVGETYDEGWTLQALTPTKATLAKDGATREVGLNPTGQLASDGPAAPSSQVIVLRSDEEILASVRAARASPTFLSMPGFGGRTMPGLSDAETERYMVLMQKGVQLVSSNRAASRADQAARPPPGSAVQITAADMLPALGAEGGELAVLLNKISMGYYNDAVAAYQRYGPVQLPRTADARADSASMADYPGARWSVGANGYVMIMPGAIPTQMVVPPDP